ncbi:MAG TPA: hypothetical protein VD788_05495, partial [Candidatus Polarisedimenticolaceae bacterium]|nr:hypothetical protein [Candidatus Polarisedimenticolaceae bacterium]
AAPVAVAAARRPAGNSAAWGVGVVVVLVAVVLAVATHDFAPQPPAPAREVRKPTPQVVASLAAVKTEIQHNEQGQMVEIAAGDPRAILDAFCRAQRRGTVDPVAIEPAGEHWTGLYRQNGQLFGIAIRRDPERDLWVAGNAVDGLEGDPISSR